MKIQTLSIGLLLFVIIGCKQNNQKELNTGEDNIEEIKNIIERKNSMIETALLNGDVEAAAKHFANNVVQMPPNGEPIIGIDAYKEYWNQGIGFGKWTFDLQTTEVKVNGNIAVELGSYYLEVKANETAPFPDMKDKGNYIVLWEKIDNDWKIVWDAPVSSVPLPTPPTAIE